MSTTQLNTGGFNLASGLSGFAIGAAATVLAFVAINPNANSAAPTNTADAGVLTIPGVDGGLSTSSLPQVGQTATLANGTKVTRLAGGQLRVTDTAGHTRTVVVGGSAGTASRTIAGSAGTNGQTVGGSAGTQSQTVGGSAGSQGAAGSANGSTQGGAGGSGSASGSGSQGTGASGASGCSGGATDTGVTATSIKLGATVAETGIAQHFLGEARQGMEAYKNRVNSQGGVCGRKLTVKYVDDGWKPDDGKTDLENLINDDKVFAIAVAPSSEGVNAASNAGVFKNAGVPVVGTNGLAATQYKDPYIWPVAAATVTLLHVMLAQAWADGARNPAIVFDNQYKFGTEGANAFEKAYEDKSGRQTIPGSDQSSCGSTTRFCGIEAAQGQYGSQVSDINNACKAHDQVKACDYLVLLLEPLTAQQWMLTPGAPTAAQFGANGKPGMGAAQPLFTYDFGTQCKDKCNGLQVWTGYNPPLEQFAGTPGVKQYVNDLKGQNGSADVYNQFTEGSYLGMQLLVDAIGRAGGNLTRAGLKTQLDQTTLDTGLSASPATFAAGQHWAVGGAQGFTMQSSNGFSGWRLTTPYLQDPWLGKDFG